MRRLTLVCDDRQAEAVERLAQEFELTEQEVLRQLVEVGLEHIDAENDRERNRV